MNKTRENSFIAKKFQLTTSTLALVFVSAILMPLISGCSKRYHDLPAFSSFPIVDAQNNSVGRFKTSYLGEQIDAYFRGSVAAPIAVATFVDIDNLYNTSTFGRVVSEQLMSELAMRGYTVIEMRQAEALQVMDRKGEFGLSRDTNTLRESHEVAALVVGTYAISPLRVYINARLIDPTTSIVTSVGSVEMEKTKEITRMLRSHSFPPSLERIPVRRLGYSSFPQQSYGQFAPIGSGHHSNQLNLESDIIPELKEEVAPKMNKSTITAPVEPTLEPTT